MCCLAVSLLPCSSYPSTLQLHRDSWYPSSPLSLFLPSSARDRKHSKFKSAGPYWTEIGYTGLCSILLPWKLSYINQPTCQVPGENTLLLKHTNFSVYIIPNPSTADSCTSASFPSDFFPSPPVMCQISGLPAWGLGTLNSHESLECLWLPTFLPFPDIPDILWIGLSFMYIGLHCMGPGLGMLVTAAAGPPPAQLPSTYGFEISSQPTPLATADAAHPAPHGWALPVLSLWSWKSSSVVSSNILTLMLRR